MKRINKYPTQIVGPFKSAEMANDESSMHKSLLDMGESFLTYLVGIMFGEYKRSGEISDKLETEFYKYSSRKPSFGVFLSFMRLLSKEMNDTLLSNKFDKSNRYASVSDFVFNFKLLKSVIDEGSDDGFNDSVYTLKKGRNASQNGLMDFFDTFIMIRNIFAHPDEKAGPKDNKRKWPLGEEYYAFINPYIFAALTELVEDFDILSAYKPVIARMLDDKNKKGTFVLEQGGKESEIDMDLSRDDLRFMNTDIRYLLDPDDKLFVKLYYHAIPQLNPKVAKKIIDREKAKAMEPHLKDMIHGKLADDGKIDDMEYLVLRDTAKTSSISDERLFQLIDAVKNQLQIKDSVGTPENKGDIFIEAKDDKISLSFNPWWLNYLSVVGKVDPKIIKKEKAKEKQLQDIIKKLKANKKSLPINKRIENAKKNLKKKKGQKATQLKKMRERVSSKVGMRKKATKPERKAALLDDINSLRDDIETKREMFDIQIEELVEKLNIIDQEKSVKTKDIDNKILAKSNELEQYSSTTQWGMHKELWQEINQYLDSFLDQNLNLNLSDDDEDSENMNLTRWVNSPNQWQIGNLSYTYWAKIHSENSTLGLSYHVGLAIAKKFDWHGKNVLDDSLTESLKKPSTVVWTSQDVKIVRKIDDDGLLGEKRIELINDLLKDYEKELLDIGANVNCLKKKEIDHLYEGPDNQQYFMPLKVFFELKDDYQPISIYSRIWTLDSFIKQGNVNVESLNKYKKEMSIIIPILCNSVTMLNNYALEIGINQETIDGRLDRFNRLKNIMFKEFEKKYPEGTLFRPTKDEAASWRLYAKEELEIESNYIYNMIYGKYRFKGRGLPRD